MNITKNASGKMVSILAATLTLFTACQKKQNEPSYNSLPEKDQTEVLADSRPMTSSKTAWFPLKTVFKDIPGGTYAEPPEGWSYIGTTAEGKSVYMQNKAASSITCTCSFGLGTCKPFEATGIWGTTRGCTGTCTNCTMSQSVTQRESYEIASGGYFQAEAPARLLQNGERIPAVFNELLNHPEFQQKLKAFYDKAYNGEKVQSPIYATDGSMSAPDGYCLVGASIMGRGMGVIVPDEYARRELGQAFKTKASCKCSNTSGKCILQDKTILGMGSIWCDGTCNGCTLTTNGKEVSPVGIYQVDIFAANF